ncbi:MAG: glycosyltransferase family 4 protein [Streptosporangiaceae bacterium]|jgi:glycosyltransferase involved in cell wall biosynthesis
MEIDRALLPPARCLPAMPPGTLPGASADQAKRHTARRIVIVAWRDVASPQAGGSELLVDQLAAGLTARGDRVALLCGGPVADHDYDVVRSGGPYTQFLRAPFAFGRRLRDCDVVVEVCNGMPFLAPLWSRQPTVCMVNHVHSDLWPLRFRPPVSTAGRFLEERVMPWAHRRNLVLTVSASTARELQSLGVDRERIRMLNNGVAPAGPAVPRSAEPMFLALGRLADYKRIDLLLRLWDRVRPVVGGRLVIAGDGPERGYLESLAGPGVTFTGRVSEQEKHRLLGSAWLLVHPALIEGWGIVVAEAAVRGTPTVGFDVPGLRDSVEHGRTGLLAPTEAGFASAWAALALDHGRRTAMGHAARRRAAQLRWSTAVQHFSAVIDEAMGPPPSR